MASGATNGERTPPDEAAFVEAAAQAVGTPRRTHRWHLQHRVIACDGGDALSTRPRRRLSGDSTRTRRTAARTAATCPYPHRNVSNDGRRLQSEGPCVIPGSSRRTSKLAVPHEEAACWTGGSSPAPCAKLAEPSHGMRSRGITWKSHLISAVRLWFFFQPSCRPRSHCSMACAADDAVRERGWLSRPTRSLTIRSSWRMLHKSAQVSKAVQAGAL